MASPASGDQLSQRGKSPETSVGNEVFLAQVYSGASEGAFRGPKALHTRVKALGRTDISLQECKNFLRSQPSYSLYRPARKRYSRNAIIAHYAGQSAQIDLMDLPRYVEANDGYRYIMICYDSYSKFLTCIPLKKRSTPVLLAAIEYLIETIPYTITHIYSDRESGLMSRPVQTWFRANSVHHYTTTSQVKAPGVERCIRTLRNALHRYFETSGSTRWLEYLSHFTDLYNNRRHSTTGQRPLDVVSDPTLLIPHGHQPPPKNPPVLPPVGSYVRISRIRSPFEKEATRTGLWSREIFKVTAHKLGQAIPMLSLADLTGTEIKGSFYADEVQLIEFDGAKTVQTVHATRKRGQRKEQLVSYAGYPSSFAEWIEA